MKNTGATNKSKLIVVVGPTASGKSDLAVRLAQKFNGAVVSADSRQVYKGMDIGSGKITKKEMRGIPHYLLGVASPRRQFSVVRYKKLAVSAIAKIRAQGKLPIICGGTGLYIRAVVDGIAIPEVKPDLKLREELSRKTAEQLYDMLKKLDPRRAASIERSNPRRLIRAIEIVTTTGKAVPELKRQPLDYPVLFIGIQMPQDKIAKRIAKRLANRLEGGMIKEVNRLRKSGISFKKLESFGLEYKLIALYLQKKITRTEMAGRIQKESEHYSKRQITWFKPDPRINWLDKYSKVEALARSYLKAS